MPQAGTEEHDHSGHDLDDVLGHNEHAGAQLAGNADGVLGVVDLVLVVPGLHHHEVPVHDRSVDAMAHLNV